MADTTQTLAPATASPETRHPAVQPGTGRRASLRAALRSARVNGSDRRRAAREIASYPATRSASAVFLPARRQDG